MKCLKLQHDEPLSNFAFNFNLRRYNWVELPEYRDAVPDKIVTPAAGSSAGAYTRSHFGLM